MLSGVRVASYAQALQGLRTETCGCGTLRIGKACRLSLATRSSSAHLCDEPALCYICGSVIIHIFDQSEMRQRVFQIVRRHTINSTAHPRGEAKLRMQRRLFPKRGCPFNPSLYTGCCTDVTTCVMHCVARAMPDDTGVTLSSHPRDYKPIALHVPFLAVLLRLRSEPSSRPEQ